MNLRDKYIVNGIEKYGKTQIELGKELKISRERVRQIYNKHGNYIYNELLQIRLDEREAEKIRKLQSMVRFHCAICKKAIYYVDKDGNRTHGWIVCTSCRQKQLGKTKLTCDWCEKSYFPNRSKYYLSTHTSFCTRECYFKFLGVFKKSVYHKRLRRKSLQIAELKKTIKRLQNKVATLKGKPLEIKTKRRKKKMVNSKPSTVNHRDNHCRICTINMISDAYDLRSEQDPTVCVDCTGESTRDTIEEKSLTNSGVIQGK